MCGALVGQGRYEITQLPEGCTNAIPPFAVVSLAQHVGNTILGGSPAAFTLGFCSHIGGGLVEGASDSGPPAASQVVGISAGVALP